jgi:hypothetical protein
VPQLFNEARQGEANKVSFNLEMELGNKKPAKVTLSGFFICAE